MKPKLTVVLVIIFILLCGLIMAAVLLGSLPSGSGNANNTSSTSSTTISVPAQLVGLQDPAIAAKYFLAAIKPDDTVVVINPNDQEEIVVNLDKRQWQKPRWSPDGKLLAVLGVTDDVRLVYDIFIYDLVRAKWSQVTNYASLGFGVDGYAWLDASRLMFTQGPEGNHWLHRFDYRNQETRKEFSLAEVLVEVQLSNQQLITKSATGNQWVVYSFKGDPLVKFDDPKQAELWTKDRQTNFLLQIGDALQVWDFDDPVLRIVAQDQDTQLIPVCWIDEDNLIVVAHDLSTNIFSVGQKLLDSSPIKNTQRLDVVSARVGNDYPKFAAICSEKDVLLGVTERVDQNQTETRWYLAELTSLKLQYLGFVNNYRDMQLR